MIRLEIDPADRAHRLAVVTVDDPGRQVNLLSIDDLDAVDGMISTIDGERDVVAVVLRSGKGDHFIAGGDVETFAGIEDRREIEAIVRRSHVIYGRIAASRKPWVAAIGGACLAAGLEVALACQGRICSDSPATELGMPEVRLGLIPSGGGLARLSRLVGLRETLGMVLTARRVRPRRAARIGLVDKVVPRDRLLDFARDYALALARGDVKPRQGPGDDLLRTAVEGNPIGRRLVFFQARRQAEARTHGLYPAPLVAIDLLERGATLPVDDAIALVPPAFAELAVGATSRALVGLFTKARDMEWRVAYDDAGHPVPASELTRIGMVGGGFMGADIASVAAEAGMETRIREVSPEDVARAMTRAKSHFDRRARQVGDAAVFQARGRIHGSETYEGFEGTGLVIEAVPEELELKREVFRELETHCSADTVLATNTSALTLAQIAEGLEHPERVVGMHFFSPVRRRPLLEIVRGPETSLRTLAVVLDFARRIHKVPLLVGDGPGLYTTRVLAFTILAALDMVQAGHAVEDVDEAARRVGWSMGPFEVVDQLGVPMTMGIARTMADAFPERFTYPEVGDRVAAAGWTGRGAGRGFYVHPSSGRRKVDPGVYALFEGRSGSPPRERLEVLGERLSLVAAAEAVRCLDEGVLDDPRAGDVGAVLGIGYPPVRGGPFAHLDLLGLDAVHGRLRGWEGRFGPTFRAPSLLRQMAEEGRSFADWPVPGERAGP